MKKIGFIVFAIAIIIGVSIASLFSWGKATGEVFNVSVNFGSEKGSGTTAVENREARDFNRVEVGGVFQVEIIAQSEFGVEVEGDDNLLQFIKTEVSNGTLEISMDKRVKTHNPLRVRVSAPDINGLQVSGASKVNLSNLKNQKLAVDSSGASKINVSGDTYTFTAEVSGASQIEAGGLSTVITNIDASGASHVNVNVSKDLTADASGASRITYTGPAHVSKSTSGASSVSQK
jgi:hypothetical protein